MSGKKGAQRVNGARLDRSQLLAGDGRRVESVEVAGLGSVGIRVLSARETLALEGAMTKAGIENVPGLVAAQLAAFVCDGEGKPILTVDDAEQLLDRWSAGQVRAVIEVGTRLNSLGDKSVEAAGGN